MNFALISYIDAYREESLIFSITFLYKENK